MSGSTSFGAQLDQTELNVVDGQGSVGHCMKVQYRCSRLPCCGRAAFDGESLVVVWLPVDRAVEPGP